MAHCNVCGGEGKISSSPCKGCAGQGRFRAGKELTVDIPAGIAGGQRIRIADRGDAGARGGQHGDLYVQVRVEQDERFGREGDHLVTLIEVPMHTAATGGTMTVPTLEGDEETEIPAGSQSGERIVLKGKGFPSLEGRGVGDLIIYLSVLIPRHLNDEQRKLLQQFEKEVDEKTYKRDRRVFTRLRDMLR